MAVFTDPVFGIQYDDRANSPPFRPCSGRPGERDQASGVTCPESGLIDAFSNPVIGQSAIHERLLRQAVISLLNLERGGGEGFSELFEDQINQANAMVGPEMQVSMTDALDSLTICTPTEPEPIVPGPRGTGRTPTGRGATTSEPSNRDEIAIARAKLSSWVVGWTSCAGDSLVSISLGRPAGQPVPAPTIPGPMAAVDFATCMATPDPLGLPFPAQMLACLAQFGAPEDPSTTAPTAIGKVVCICL